MSVTRTQAYEAISGAILALDPNATPSEIAAAGAEACLLALAHTRGAKVAAQVAYDMADLLATTRARPPTGG